MKAEILSVGTELLLGEIVDTNASWLAQQLPFLGIDLFYISTVGDNSTRVVETLQRAYNRSDLIICTGGLGPTDDDLTREGISELLKEPMVVQPELEKRLRDWFAMRKSEMPLKNLKQATLIASAQALTNSVGTAPGWWVEHGDKIIVCMPGVPHEMKTMWETQVVPRLKQRPTGKIIISRTLKILGKGESGVEEMVQDFIVSTNPTLATYAKPDGVHLRITAKAASEAEARDLIFDMEIQLRERLGTLIYAQDDESLENIIGEMLMDRLMTLAVMEVGTGGSVTATLTNSNDAPQFFRGGLIGQQHSTLVSWGVDRELLEEQGIFSPGVVEAMATAARQSLGAETGLAVVAVPGPASIEGKNPGLVYIAVDFAGEVKSVESQYRTNPSEVKRMACITALNLLRKAMIK